MVYVSTETCSVSLQVADVGGSMFIHTFGAYFGLAVARVVYTMEVKDSANEGSSYHGDLFSMIGLCSVLCRDPMLYLHLQT